MRYPYIAIEGLIGAGKTTLARRLADRWLGRLVLEEFDDNPFLPRFYEDPQRFAFSVELSFLAQRYHQLKRTTEQDLFSTCTVADYSIGKSLVFAGATLGPDEHSLFRDLYDIMYADLPRPDLLVYLHLPLALVRERIRGRGRSYEMNIGDDYLMRLHERYLDHMHKLKGDRVVVLDLGHADLLRDEAAFVQLVSILQADHPPGCHVLSL